MVVEVEVFSSPGCGKCAQAVQLLRAVAEELGPEKVRWRAVNILEELDHAVDVGVLTSPAIAVNGKLVFSGLPSTKDLRDYLNKTLRG
ncbi:MAG: thioredoxin family protein [Acidiferrobacter sp.]